MRKIVAGLLMSFDGVEESATTLSNDVLGVTYDPAKE